MADNSHNYLQQIDEAAEYIRRKLTWQPQLGLILGTGLGDLADEIKNSVVFDYKDLPHFPVSTVKFHAGKLVCGALAGKSVCAMKGRFHYYEGYGMRRITLPVRVMASLGISTLIVTNAAGGICEAASPGLIGLITDHINLMGHNPLIGPHDDRLGERFPDMSFPYSQQLRALTKKVARQLDIDLLETVYAAVSGPSFETAAEIRMLQKLGVDTVGMSVVPEVLTARQLGMEVLALSVITDQSLPDRMVAIHHEDVKKVAQTASPKLKQLLIGIIQKMN